MIVDLKLKNPLNNGARHGIYREAENAKAVMTIIHGFGEHSGRYHHMMDYLAGKGVSTLAVDLTGHGRSEGKQGVCLDYEFMRADVDLALLETRQRFPDIPHILYGHSMGGALVMNYTLKREPENLAGVISSAPLLRLPKPVPGVLSAAVKLLRKIAPGMTMGQPLKVEVISSQSVEQEKYKSDPHNHGRLGVGLAQDMVEGGEWILENASAWKLPLLLMHSRDDQLTAFDGSEDFSKTAQNCTFIPYENCEHEMHNDVVRDDVYSRMSHFIEQKL